MKTLEELKAVLTQDLLELEKLAEQETMMAQSEAMHHLTRRRSRDDNSR